MAVIDIREATIRLWDGTLPTRTVLTDIIISATSKHMGTQQISVTIVDPGTTHTLSAVITDYDIVITLGYETGTITTTRAQLVAFINATTTVKALITASGTSVTVCAALAKFYLTGQKSLSCKIGEGNLTHNEQRKVKFILDRGRMDTVKLENAEPLDLSFDFTWEFLIASSGGLETIEEVLKNKGAASDWVSTADDPCRPYCIDVELLNVPGCAGTDNEQLMFEEFYKESLAHDLKAGTIACKGRCNRIHATVRRNAA
jgi:hypothetical protein